MVNTMRLIAMISLLLALPLQAAEISVKSLEKQVNAFKQSGMHRFAPQTTSRVDAYLGAAMLAKSKQQPDEMNAALTKASEMLDEAKTTASGFQQTYSELLQLRKETRAVVEIVASAPQIANNLVASQQMAEADQVLDQVIITREQGDLNRTAELAATADQAYRRILINALPQLSELAATELSSASAKGAKKFAPVIYETAKSKLASLRAYIDGIDATLPRHAGDTYYLAAESIRMANQVKLWRKKTGSHENNALQARKFRQQLAEILELDVSQNVLLVDISDKRLIDQVQQLKTALEDERRMRIEDAARLKQQYEEELNSRLTAQTDELKQAQHSQLTDMKEAFRAKLEKETFEKKRQAQLRSRFQKGDADIFVNLDGSLLIRMHALQFPPGRSKIDQKSYDLLGRLKSALELYTDRTVRIEGHTDNVGDVKPNQQLSLKRAESVRDFLIAAGTDGARLKALGYGEVRPIASNEFKQGRAMNRRIDIVISAAQ